LRGIDPSGSLNTRKKSQPSNSSSSPIAREKCDFLLLRIALSRPSRLIGKKNCKTVQSERDNFYLDQQPARKITATPAHTHESWPFHAGKMCAREPPIFGRVAGRDFRTILITRTS
jgi:hypothetical protein